jgi:2-methylcitrate dehydratase PrpD
MSYTEALSRFSARTQFAEIPAEVRHDGKRLILDTLGNTLAGSTMGAPKRAAAVKARMGGAPESTVVRGGFRTSCQNAVFANVIAASALEADDTCLHLGHHAHCAILPALAIAESRRKSGADFLAAIIVAYELGARIAKAGRRVVMDDGGKLRSSQTGGSVNWVVFPAVVGAARLLGVDDDRQMASALGLAGYGATVPTGLRWNRPGWNDMKYNPYAFMAESATLAALLTEGGFTGDPDIFDGAAADIKAPWWQMSGFVDQDPEAAIEGLGETWLTSQASLKPYPSCRFSHGPLWLFDRIRRAEQLRLEEIEQVDIHVNRAFFDFHMESPDILGEPDCGFSMPHLIAMSAMDIPVGPKWSSREYWSHPQVDALKARVLCHPYPKANELILQQQLRGRWERTPHAIEVRARGRRFREESDYTLGDPHSAETRFSDDALIAIFKSFTDGILHPDDVQRCVDIVMILETQPELTALLELLR